MKLLRKIGFFCFCLSILISCNIKNKEKTKAESNIRIIEINIEDAYPIYYSTLFDSIEYFVIPESFDVCDIIEMMPVDKYIYIIESFPGCRVLKYDILTKTIKQVGMKGEGPGEYKRAGHLCYNWDKKLIGVLDEGGHNILWYDLMDNHISSQYKSFHSSLDFSYVGTNNFLHNTNHSPDNSTLGEEYAYNAILIDSVNRTVDRFIPYLPNLNISAIARNNNSFTQYVKKNPLYYDIYCDTLFRVSITNLTPEFVIDFGKHNIPDGIMNEIFYNKNISSGQLYDEIKQNYCTIIHALENESYIYLVVIGNNIRRIFYNKKTKKISQSPDYPINDMSDLPSFYYCTAIGDYFYGFIPASRLVDSDSKLIDKNNENPILVRARVR